MKNLKITIAYSALITVIIGPVTTEVIILQASDIPPGVAEVNLPRRRFTNISENAFDTSTGITALNLVENNLTVLGREVFKKLTNLTSLFLDDNQITNAAGAFVNLGKLELLGMEGNELVDPLVNGYFYGLKSSVCINVKGCSSLTRIGSRAFKEFTAPVVTSEPLADSDESENAAIFKKIIDVCVVNGALRSIVIVANDNVPKDKTVCDPKRLTMDDDDNDDKMLHRLNLTSLSITTLEPDYLKTLELTEQATLIDMSFNQIADFPSGAFPVSLIELNLTSNLFTTIKNNHFSNLKNLEVLNLSNNRITTIEPAAFAMPDLTVLNLNHNSITTIDGLFLTGKERRTYQSKLSELDIGFNKISSIQNVTFAKMPFLVYINIAGNVAFRRLEHGVFRGIGVDDEAQIVVSPGQIDVIKANAFD